MSFKVGDKVKITKNLSGHDFKVGDVVIVTKVYAEGRGDENYDGSIGGEGNWFDWWGFTNKEAELVV